MFARIITIISGLALIGLGVGFHIWPQELGAFVDFSLPTSTAKIEIGTFYGGFQIGAGVMCLLALKSQRSLNDALLYQAILYFLSAFCRFLGILRFGNPGQIIYELISLEFLAFLCAAWAWRVETKASKNG